MYWISRASRICAPGWRKVTLRRCWMVIWMILS
ncbi:MAG: hypothetical protein ACRESE_03555, partial [Gammaproteobacteria bacterium]